MPRFRIVHPDRRHQRRVAIAGHAGGLEAVALGRDGDLADPPDPAGDVACDDVQDAFLPVGHHRELGLPDLLAEPPAEREGRPRRGEVVSVGLRDADIQRDIGSGRLHCVRLGQAVELTLEGAQRGKALGRRPTLASVDVDHEHGRVDGRDGIAGRSVRLRGRSGQPDRHLVVLDVARLVGRLVQDGGSLGGIEVGRQVVDRAAVELGRLPVGCQA